MSDEKTEEKPRSAWSHDVKIGLEPLRDGVLKTREAVVKTMEEIQREIERHRAAFGRMKGG